MLAAEIIIWADEVFAFTISLVAFLGSPGDLQGASWGPGGPPGGFLVASCGRPVGLLGASWGPPGCFLGASWGPPGGGRAASHTPCVGGCCPPGGSAPENPVKHTHTHCFRSNRYGSRKHFCSKRSFPPNKHANQIVQT